MKYNYLFLLVLVGLLSSCRQGERSPYLLYQRIAIPTPLLQTQRGASFGGDIRVGDLQNNGKLGFINYRAANSVKDGATQPCFIGAFTLEGKVLWKKGSGGQQPNRPGPIAIHDLDADGENEIICLFVEDTSLVRPFSMQNISLQILNSQDGSLEREVSSAALGQARGEGPNWVHQRILIANLRGMPTPQDFIIKLGKTIYAFDHQLHLLWTYFNANDVYQNCPAYIPAVGDIDGDGRDEINGGYYLLDHDGIVMWEKKLGKNMDSVSIDYWDNDSIPRAFCSGYGFVMDHLGDTILSIGEDGVPHGQELRVADFDPQYDGPEMAIRYDGHNRGIRIINLEGKILRSFEVNASPNNTGMEAVYWNGPNQPALLYNGGSLWDGQGELFCRFSELSDPPLGTVRQGWYHCITLDLVGDKGEEVILYNPWEDDIYIYTAGRKDKPLPKAFVPTPKQYNVRLMD